MPESAGGVQPHELVPRGGEWFGFLFDNPSTGFDPKLTWSFAFAFEELDRSYGTTEPRLALDWVPFETTSWQSLAGKQVVSDRFGEPIESSLYVFEHFRYEHVDIRILDQRDTDAQVAVRIWGDLDGLGLETHDVDGWLRFEGIYVQPSSRPDSVESARALLASFTDVTDLVGVRQEHNVLFRPAHPEPSK